MSYSFDTSWTPYTKVLPFKPTRDLPLATQAETFRNQSPEWIPAAERPDTPVRLCESDRHSTGEERLKEHRSVSGGEHVDCTGQGGDEMEGFCSGTLL